MDKAIATAPGYARDRDLTNQLHDACATERQPHVAEAVIGHRSVAERIAETISHLEKRLTAVTRNEPTPTDGGCKDAAAAQRSLRVELAEAIEANNTSLEQSWYRLRSILDRLEL